MIPDFYDGKFLPEGDHLATWGEVVRKFGGNACRRGLCDRLGAFLLKAKRCGFRKVYLFGSFISAKEEPGDVDLLWVYERDLDIATIARECQDLLSYTTMKAREKWDMFCCTDDPFAINYLMKAWRVDKGPARTPRGVILLEIGDL
jgi:hypothetical protein